MIGSFELKLFNISGINTLKTGKPDQIYYSQNPITWGEN